MTTEALGDVTVQSLRLNGTGAAVDVIEGITAADISRPIDAAPTLTLSVEDSKRILLTAPIFAERTTCQIDQFSFELVQIRKSGDQLQMTFEDIVSVRLRSHTDPRVIEAGSMTRVEFCRELIKQEPWIDVVVAPYPVDVIKEQLAQGTVKTPKKAIGGKPVTPEDTWTATGRIMDEIGWRRFIRNPSEILLAPDAWIIQQPPVATVREFQNGVDSIDFDWDVGKPKSTCTIACRATRWDFAPGAVVVLDGVGVADGPWLVSKIERSLFSSLAKITLIQPEPVLDEPESSASDTTNVDMSGEAPLMQPTGPNDGTGLEVDPGAVSPTGFIWPVTGTITSGFGPRNGKMHEGLDIAVPNDTPVQATKDGTVTHADEESGYGQVVYIEHADTEKRADSPRPGVGVESRYGHLHSFNCTRGQQVKQGDVIGYSGGVPGEVGAGDATGPHVHFEIRIAGVPKNPLDYLTGTGAFQTTKPTPGGHFQ